MDILQKHLKKDHVYAPLDEVLRYVTAVKANTFCHFIYGSSSNANSLRIMLHKCTYAYHTQFCFISAMSNLTFDSCAVFHSHFISSSPSQKKLLELVLLGILFFPGFPKECHNCGLLEKGQHRSHFANIQSSNSKV